MTNVCLTYILSLYVFPYTYFDSQLCSCFNIKISLLGVKKTVHVPNNPLQTDLFIKWKNRK